MALVLNDRVQETCSSPGTGAATLLGAVTGFQTFSSGVGNGNTCYYCIADQGGANWEVGLGTYSSSGNTLTRTTPYSGSAATPVNFSSGVQTVFVTYPAERKIIQDASGNVTALGTVSSGTWQGSTVAVAYGGTGVTTSTGSTNLVLSNSPTLVTPNLGTPSAVNLTNATALPLTTGVSGVLPTANGGTNLSSFTSGGVVYASSTSALATGSALTFDGTTLNLGGTAQRITGDFSNGTYTNRVSFQSSTANGVTGVQALPNGTSNTATFDVYNAADPTNASFGQLQINASDFRVVSNIRGTGTYLPMTFFTSGGEKMRLDTSGNLLVGNTNGTSKITATGVVESTTGGFKFPDGTTQTTAATAGLTQAKATGLNFIFSI
jgi:hypothetical protein